MSSLRPLARLGSQLHKPIHQPIRAQNENNTDADVPPPMVILRNIHRGQVIRPRAILTRFASSRRTRIHEVGRPAKALEIHGQILAARLPVRRIKNCEFRLLTHDLLIPQRKREKPTHEVRERIQVVHPVSPEFGNLGIRNEHAAEVRQHGDDQGVDEAGSDGVGRIGRDELTHARVHEFVDEHDEKDGTGAGAVRGEADGVVEADEVEDGADYEVDEFADDEAGYEGFPCCGVASASRQGMVRVVDLQYILLFFSRAS